MKAQMIIKKTWPIKRYIQIYWVSESKAKPVVGYHWTAKTYPFSATKFWIIDRHKDVLTY